MELEQITRIHTNAATGRRKLNLVSFGQARNPASQIVVPQFSCLGAHGARP